MGQTAFSVSKFPSTDTLKAAIEIVLQLGIEVRNNASAAVAKI